MMIVRECVSMCRVCVYIYIYLNKRQKICFLDQNGKYQTINFELTDIF
ncbi:hypothetical protein HanPSC8_Chr06g0250671 [Helianthus annuus]|nr:hypothetical protein HanPSC8_Chr06g0250671 [Helianthus annuus]